MTKKQQPKLSRLEVNITSACNLNCTYCANDPSLKSVTILPIQKIAELLDRVKPNIVNFTGGEPTIEFELLLQAIKEGHKRGIITQLDTNAADLTHAQIDRIMGAGINRFHISYNCFEDDFVGIRHGTRKQFKRLEDNLRYLGKQGRVELLCEAVLTKQNAGQMTELYERVSSFGADEFQVQPMIPSSKQHFKLIPDQRTMKKAILDLFRREHGKTAVKVWCCYLTRCMSVAEEVYSGLEYRAGKTEQKLDITGLHSGCQEGWSRLHVHNNGDIVICDLSGYEPIGNIFNEDILEVYYNHPLLMRLRETKPAQCERCEHWESCHNICPGIVYQFTGDFKTRFCEILKERT